MKIKADFRLIKIPTSGSVAILEMNSLQHWFEPTIEEAESVTKLWDGMEVTKPQGGLRPKQTKPSKICFEASTACNLRCKYCFQNDDEAFCNSNSNMDSKIAINYLRKYFPPEKTKHVRIGFMGGEPTVSMDLICRVVDFCGKNYDRADYSLTTNGVKLADSLKDNVSINLNKKLEHLSIGEFLARHSFGITLSLDGPKAIHDSMRVRPDGSGSFDSIMASLEHLKKSVPDWLRKFSLRCTYGDNLSDPGASILDRLIFFNELIAKGYGGNIHLEPAVLLPESFSTVESQHHQATEWAISEIKAGRAPKWSEVIRRTVSKLHYHQPSIKNCGGGSVYMTCGIDGTIYACHRTAGADVGSLKDGIDTEKAAVWEDNRVYALPNCTDCEIKYICGGGCRAANYAEHGSTFIPSTTNCFVRKLRVACALRIIEALTPEELARICPQKKNTSQTKRPSGNGV